MKHKDAVIFSVPVLDSSSITKFDIAPRPEIKSEITKVSNAAMSNYKDQ